MSGHSKWHNIQKTKGAADAKRSAAFTKIAREIIVAVKAGGPDPENNSRLKDVVVKARSNNMPNDNINRTIKKAAGDGDTTNYESITYEGYGPAGVAVIVETLTDNRNRTAADVRHAFDKFGGNMGQNGCVSFMFDRKGIILIEKEGIDEDEITMAALDAGADDIEIGDELFEITTTPEDFGSVRDTLSESYTLSSAEISMIPQTMTTLENESDITNMERMLDMLEDNDDVQEVYHNWENE